MINPSALLFFAVSLGVVFAFLPMPLVWAFTVIAAVVAIWGIGGTIINRKAEGLALLAVVARMGVPGAAAAIFMATMWLVVLFKSNFAVVPI